MSNYGSYTPLGYYTPPPPPPETLPHYSTSRPSYTCVAPSNNNTNFLFIAFWIVIAILFILLIFSSFYFYNCYQNKNNHKYKKDPEYREFMKYKKNQTKETYLPPQPSKEKTLPMKTEKDDSISLKPESLYSKYLYMWEREQDNPSPNSSKYNWTPVGIVVNNHNSDLSFLLLQNKVNKAVYLIYNEVLDAKIAVLDESATLCLFLKNRQQIMIDKLLNKGYFTVYLN